MKNKFLLLLIPLFCFVSCKEKRNKLVNQKELAMHQRGRDALEYIKQDYEKKALAVTDFENSLSLEDKISQLFIENLEGNRIFTPIEKCSDITGNSSDSEYVIPGGYLYFGYNLAEDPEKIMEFNTSIKEYCIENQRIPPFLALDQEGGYVNRLRDISGPLPSCQRIVEKLSSEKACTLYTLQAIQMKMLGFNMNLAPVVEVRTEDNQQFLNQRSFGSLEQVLDYGKACINAYEQNGIGTVLKHFPGNSNTDPHTGLPEIKIAEEDLNEFLSPFKELVRENPSGVLMSHARVSSVDSEVPSCLSQVWVTQILRNLYGYNGIIFSDDIFMGALSENGYTPQKAVVMAIEAGIDCIMVSDKRIKIPAKVLYNKALSETEFQEKINAALHRIIQYKIKCGILTLKDDVTAEGKAAYKLVPVEETEELQQRLDNFEIAREENIKLYKEYF